jgi:CheY-like chemotaxis protein
MQVLFVEDNSSFAETLTSVVSKKLPGVCWDLVDNSGSAEKLLEEKFYDLVILDLCMPNVISGLEKSVEYGQRLFYSVQKALPGTPIYILTGSDPDSFATGLSRHGERIKLWGAEKEFPTVLYFKKNQAPELVEELCQVYEEVSAVNSISINTRGKFIDFTKGQDRALKTFVRSMGGVDSVYYPLSGLSGSLVGRVEVRDVRLNVIGAFVAKLGATSKIQKEGESYLRYVRLMPINTFTPLLSKMDRGLKDNSAIFYTLAEGFKENLFEVIRRDSDVALEVIQRVRTSLDRWSAVREVSKCTVGDVRRAKVSDEVFENLVKKFGLDEVRSVESIAISASVSCIHGDLHGGNVLVNQAGFPVLIDFGDVGSSYTGLDPITLEMSLIFHPDCVLSGVSKEMTSVLEHWPNIDSYIQTNPFGRVVKYCRDWAYDISGDDRSVLAAGYAFAMRQLKYETVSHEETLALIKRISKALIGSSR